MKNICDLLLYSLETHLIKQNNTFPIKDHGACMFVNALKFNVTKMFC